MLLWVAVIIISVVIVVSARFVWYRRRLEYQAKLLAAKLQKLTRQKRPDPASASRLLRRIYALLYDSIAVNPVVTYQAVELLKFAFGEGLRRANEPGRLMAAAVTALRANQPDLAGFILDAFKPMLRYLTTEDVPETVEQLVQISIIAGKAKQNFLVAKASENIFAMLEQQNCAANQPLCAVFLRALTAIGTVALRRHDDDLFREMATRIACWLATKPSDAVSSELVALLSTWLHYIVKTDQPIQFSIVEELTVQLVETKVLSDEALALLFVEWTNLAGTACLNPNTSIASLTLSLMLQLAAKRHKQEVWALATKSTGQVAKLASAHHGNLTGVFQVIYPLLEAGRKLLIIEIRFGEYTDELNRQALFMVLEECLAIVTFLARQDMTTTTGEVISDIYKHWSNSPCLRGNPKSVKKFCQLLLLFWVKIRRRQAKRGMPINQDLTEPMLIVEKDRLRLGL
jgi:hypothetical protein